MRKLITLTAFGAGYVLGARAGRVRYDQIRKAFLGVKNDPHVQEFAAEAAEFAKEHGSAVTDKVSEKVSEKVSTGQHAAQDAKDAMANPYQRATP